MKKRTREEKPAADFRNTPFKTLNKLASATRMPIEKPVPAPAVRREEVEDDAALFQRAVDGVRPMNAAPAVTEAQPTSAIPPAAQDAPGEQQLFLHAMLKMGATLRDDEPDDEEPHYRSASSRMRMLKRGTIRIAEELDLHGFMKEEALARLAQFVANTYHRGSKAVLVITGKGNNSPEGPVLQGAVSAWLREQGKGMVVETAQAPRDKGGSGAIVIFLRAAIK